MDMRSATWLAIALLILIGTIVSFILWGHKLFENTSSGRRAKKALKIVAMCLAGILVLLGLLKSRSKTDNVV